MKQSWLNVPHSALLLAPILGPLPVLAQNLLPTNPTIVAGQIEMSAAQSDVLTIGQTSATGIINWGTFNIGANSRVTFQNGDGATLSRVTGNTPSGIFGRLDATGSLYLINQNGIVIGPNGNVQTGRNFLASTLDMGDGDFINGGEALFSGVSRAKIVNFGSMSSRLGNVSLLGRHLENLGHISAPNGSAALVAGREILLREETQGDGRFLVRLGGTDTSVTESGMIRAAQVELRANGGNVYALAGNTQGAVHATGVAQRNGRVFLTSGGGGRVRVEKPVRAINADGSGGQIDVLGGTVDMSAVLDASALRGAGGRVVVWAENETQFSGRILAFSEMYEGPGGFVEVSGQQRLTFDGVVDTGGGTLLIDPQDVEITNGAASLVGASTITPASLITALTTQNVVVQTTSPDTASGTILVSDNMFYTSPYALSLFAHGDIHLNESIQNDDTTGTGDVNFVAGWDGSTGLVAGEFVSGDLDAVALNSGAFGTAGGDSYTMSGTDYLTSGSIFVGQDTILAAGGIAVGAWGGTTRTYSADLSLVAANDYFSFRQLGYSVPTDIAGLTIGGDIAVRAAGSVELVGSDADYSAAQIGHVGPGDSTDSARLTNATGTISVEAVGAVDLTAGTGSNAYALIGNGSSDFQDDWHAAGNMSGAITVETAGEISLDDSNVPALEHYRPWIGSATSGLVLASDVMITAAAFDQDSTSLVGTGIGTVSNELISTNLDFGDLSLIATNSGLTFETGSVVSDFVGDFIVSASGNLQFSSGFSFETLGAGIGGMALATGGAFENLAGSDVLDLYTNPWLIYSTRPDQDSGAIGVLPYDFIQYGITANLDDMFPVGLPAGNGLIYSTTPVVTATDQTHTYGDTITTDGVSVSVDGAIVSPLDFGFSIESVTYDSAGVPVSGDGFELVGNYSDAFSASATPASVYGLSFVDGDLTIDPATVTMTLPDESRIYDGTAGYSGPPSYSGWVGSDDDSLITVAPSYSYDGSSLPVSDAGSYGITGAGTAESSGNYTFDEADTALLTIDPATVTMTLPDEIRTYDGTAGYNGPPSYGGWAGSDDDSLITTAPSYSYDGSSTPVSDAGSYGITGAGTAESSGNYTFDETDTALLTIDPATVTMTLPDEILTYDGTAGYSGLPSYSGWVGSDDDSLITVAPSYSYDGSSLPVSDAGSYGITGAGTAESSGNYTFDEADTALLTIDPATVTMTLPDEIRTYDGTAGYSGLPSYSGWVGSDDDSLITVAPSYSYDGSSLPVSDAGSYGITGAGTAESSGNYTFDETDTALLTILPVDTDPTLPLPPLGRAPEPAPIDGFSELNLVDPIVAIYVDVSMPVNTPTPNADERFDVKSVLVELEAATQSCAQIPDKRYLVDCLSDRLEAAAQALPDTGELGEAKAEIVDAARKLGALANANRSLDAPGMVRAPRVGNLAISRPLFAVNEAQLNAVTAEAFAVINELETRLLRSSEGTSNRSSDVQRIAQAVGSNKVLLRSF
ncbi:two-partner secretion domain-containing protein [Parasedimentitalea maritima]|uniref:Filamentous hemagglutinin N-terminal domain-containing protein n=1 Tax=Parasedimentitalea maritima TaxID=2578117 RepID=A0A6A4RCE6_9RHOB|nr:filamentous hemagglutinin N-terminal domain-containing protein [Zongyanglinia marina]KAE9627697.1 filamentous hemagglutinin N-terminal domain-containing protein [Zongyanglinia marina]